VNLVETGKRMMLGTGAQTVLAVLLALSVVSGAIVLERLYAYARRYGSVEALRAKLVFALERGGLAAAAEAMRASRHPAAKVALRALVLTRPNAKQADEAMNAEIVAQKTQLEWGLGTLATLGANAPFVGLFGTVVGIVGAFDALGHGSSMQGSLQVMAAIGEALVATAVGIGVAIPAIAAFNAFSRSSARMLAGAEILQKEILAYLASGSVTEGSGAHDVRLASGF
jgi:biopolymer transport protein ExbB